MAEPKGMRLEQQFAHWMEAELGYTQTKLRVPAKGMVRARAYEADIRGVLYDSRAHRLKQFGIGLFFLAILAQPLGLTGFRQWMEQVVGSFNPAWVGSAVGIFALAGIVVGILGERRSRVIAWVECKDTGKNVKGAQVQKLAAAVKDVKDSQETPWKPDVVMVVSGTDFDDDALNVARKERFVCYRRSGEGFEKVA